MLGTKYSMSMNATFLDAQGKEKPFIMGCYGIGIGRTAAASIEQNHDERGIIWPWALAPFQVYILPVNVRQSEVMEAASDIYQKLADLIQHFYLMAHTSPDPIRNNTWRTVDVTVNLPRGSGNYQLQGFGRYFVEGGLPADLSVNLVSITDTTISEANDTMNAVIPGEIYDYQILIKNQGPNKSNYVKRLIQFQD